MSKVGAAILHALAAALGRGRCALCGKCVYDEARSDARDPEASSKGQVTCNANDLMDTSNSIYQRIGYRAVAEALRYRFD